MVLDLNLQNADFCRRKAKEYTDKAASATDASLRAAYAALAREYIRRARGLPSIGTAGLDRGKLFASPHWR